MVGVIQLMKS